MDQIYGHRAGIAFATVNRPGRPGFVEGMERHHLVVTQCLRDTKLRSFFAELVPFGFRLNDFSRNGMLLPSLASLSDRIALPIHRGPHPNYSEQVIEQVMRIADASRWIEGPKLRARFAVGALRAAQRRLRTVITQHGPGPIDAVIVGWRTDLEIDAAVDALMAAKHSRRLMGPPDGGSAHSPIEVSESAVFQPNLARI